MSNEREIRKVDNSEKKKVIRKEQYSNFHYKRVCLPEGSTTSNPRKIKDEMYFFLYFFIINLKSRSILHKIDFRKVVWLQDFLNLGRSWSGPNLTLPLRK